MTEVNISDVAFGYVRVCVLPDGSNSAQTTALSHKVLSGMLCAALEVASAAEERIRKVE